MVVYLASSFSLGMLEQEEVIIKIRKISEQEVRKILEKEELISAVGHKATAELLSKKLGIKIEAQRIQIKLKKGEKLVVFQLLQRLPEGAVLSEEEVKRIPSAWFLVQII